MGEEECEEECEMMCAVHVKCRKKAVFSDVTSLCGNLANRFRVSSSLTLHPADRHSSSTLSLHMPLLSFRDIFNF